MADPLGWILIGTDGIQYEEVVDGEYITVIFADKNDAIRTAKMGSVYQYEPVAVTMAPPRPHVKWDDYKLFRKTKYG